MPDPLTRPSPLAAVPTLDAIATDPAVLDVLPRHALVDLYATAARLEAALRARLLTPETDRAPAAEADRVLGIDEAAQALGMTRDFLYRQWGKLGLGYKDADGRVKFAHSKIQRYIRAHAGR